MVYEFGIVRTYEFMLLSCYGTGTCCMLPSTFLYRILIAILFSNAWPVRTVMQFKIPLPVLDFLPSCSPQSDCLRVFHPRSMCTCSVVKSAVGYLVHSSSLFSGIIPSSALPMLRPTIVLPPTMPPYCPRSDTALRLGDGAAPS